MNLKNIIKNFKENCLEKKKLKHIKRTQDKHTTTENRYAAFDALKKMGTNDAILGLIGRFSFNSEKTIVDKEEKEYVTNILINFGDKAVDPLKEFIKISHTIAWPIQILSKLISESQLIDFLISIISTEELLFDEKGLDKRIELLNIVSIYKNEKITNKAIQLLNDDDDEVKLKAIEILEKQNDEQAREPLLSTLVSDNTPNRIKMKIFETFAHTNWTISGYRKKIEEILPSGYYINKEGQIRIRIQEY